MERKKPHVHSTWKLKANRGKPFWFVMRVSDRFVWADNIETPAGQLDRFSRKQWDETMDLWLEAREVVTA